MWHTICLLLINHKREPPHSSPHFTSSYEFSKDENLLFFEESIWRERGEAWSERLSCSLREGSHSDKRYQINERDDEAGHRGRGMIFLNCNHCCRQQSRDPSRWEILHSGGENDRHERNMKGSECFNFAPLKMKLLRWLQNPKFQPTVKLLMLLPGCETANVALLECCPSSETHWGFLRQASDPKC